MTYIPPPIDLSAVDQEWRNSALCAQTDPEIFYPEKGSDARDAKKVCLQCTVRTECLAFALDSRERYGVYGGLTERQRRPLLGLASKDAA